MSVESLERLIAVINISPQLNFRLGSNEEKVVMFSLPERYRTFLVDAVSNFLGSLTAAKLFLLIFGIAVPNLSIGATLINVYEQVIGVLAIADSIVVSLGKSVVNFMTLLVNGAMSLVGTKFDVTFGFQSHWRSVFTIAFLYCARDLRNIRPKSRNEPPQERGKSRFGRWVVGGATAFFVAAISSVVPLSEQTFWPSFLIGFAMVISISIYDLYKNLHSSVYYLNELIAGGRVPAWADTPMKAFFNQAPRTGIRFLVGTVLVIAALGLASTQIVHIQSPGLLALVVVVLARCLFSLWNALYLAGGKDLRNVIRFSLDASYWSRVLSQSNWKVGLSMFLWFVGGAAICGLIVFERTVWD